MYDRLQTHMTPSIKFIVLAVGTNDMVDFEEDWVEGVTKDNVDVTVTTWAVEEMQQLVGHIQSAYPQCHIIIPSIPPRGKNHSPGAIDNGKRSFV